MGQGGDGWVGVGVVELRLIVLHDLLQVRLCESRSDRELVHVTAESVCESHDMPLARGLLSAQSSLPLAT